jgi:predicted amidohydrolase
MSVSIRLGVVQPQGHGEGAAPKMLQDALTYIVQASDLGVNLLLFPELYPDPVSHQFRYNVLDALCEAAAKRRVALAAGTSIRATTGGTAYHIAHVVIDERGELKGQYLRTHPRSHIYRNLYNGNDAYLAFDYETGGDFSSVRDALGQARHFDLQRNVYSVARILAFKGAEVCLFPCGLLVDDSALPKTGRRWSAPVPSRT